MTAFQEWFSNFSNLFYKCFIRDDRYKLLLDGIGVTVKVSLLAILIGVVIGMLVALCNLSRRKVIRFLGSVYTDVIRGTPSVTQLMIIYFVIFATVDLDKWIIARSHLASIPAPMCRRSSAPASCPSITDRRKRADRWG